MNILRALSIFVIISFLAIGCGGGDSETKTGNVEGTVTDTNTGELLSGVTVSTGDKLDTTGSNGVYSINSLESGNRTVSVSFEGYQSYSGSCNVIAESTITNNITLTPIVIGDDSILGTWLYAPENNTIQFTSNNMYYFDHNDGNYETGTYVINGTEMTFTVSDNNDGDGGMGDNSGSSVTLPFRRNGNFLIFTDSVKGDWVLSKI